MAKVRDGLHVDSDGWWSLRTVSETRIALDKETDTFRIAGHPSGTSASEYTPVQILLPLELML